MAELSPAAQAVLLAIWRAPDDNRDSYRAAGAAALRAAADQFFFDWNGMCCEEHLKAIAAELEGAQ